MYQLQAGLFTTPWLLTSIYDTAPLRDTLAELVDPRRLDDDTTRVIVGAINVAIGVMEYFRSRQPGGLTFEHVAASGSLPPSFPMTPAYNLGLSQRRAQAVATPCTTSSRDASLAS
jgi:NTE family protein